MNEREKKEHLYGSRVAQATVQLTGNPYDKDPFRRKQQMAIGAGEDPKGLKDSKSPNLYSGPSFQEIGFQDNKKSLFFEEITERRSLPYHSLGKLKSRDGSRYKNTRRKN